TSNSYRPLKVPGKRAVGASQAGDCLQTRQSSGAVGNGAEGRDGTGPLDRTPRTSMTMAVTTSALPMQPIYVSAGSCSAADGPNLQRRRLRQQEPQELSLTRPADTAASSSSVRDEPVRTPLSANVLLSLPASPKRSSASHSSSSKTPAISKSQMKEFREAFRLFDKDGDGTITKEELGRVMRSLGQFARAEELRTMLQEIDIDGDGNVSFEEFVEIVSNMGASTAAPSDQHQEEQELRDAFRVFDKHNRGYITASDLRAVLQCLGEDLSEEEIEDMIKEVDVDGDGRIDFYEFVHALGEPGIDEDEEDDDEDLQSPLY
ncbi:PREDICTED: probable calcium-binding protein CML11, partial [Vollenhovia emeryi]|uniref:probable calcium-binding protein CML11 n=1 Tax=Vollenhovia emeryi TaxID=411798 RepID=UPI0005F3DCED